MADQDERQEQTPNDATGGGEQPSGETYDKATVERMIQDRLKREREKYSDYSDLKKKAQQWQEYEDAQRTELERLQKKAQEAEEARDKALADAERSMIRAAFVAEASARGVKRPDDAYALAMADGAEIVVEDGRVVGVAEAVGALVESGRLPVGQARPPSLNGGAGASQTEKQAQLTEAELVTARKLRLTPEQYAKAKERR